MTALIKLWQIPRTDTRPRCGNCLKIIKKGQLSIKDPTKKGTRFPLVHMGCKVTLSTPPNIC